VAACGLARSTAAYGGLRRRLWGLPPKKTISGYAPDFFSPVISKSCFVHTITNNHLLTCLALACVFVNVNTGLSFTAADCKSFLLSDSRMGQEKTLRVNACRPMNDELPAQCYQYSLYCPVLSRLPSNEVLHDDAACLQSG